MSKDTQEIKKMIGDMFTHKEIASSKLNIQIDTKLGAIDEKIDTKFDALEDKVDAHHIQQVDSQKKNEAHQKRTEDMLKTWNNAQGFVKISKWLAGAVVGILVFWQVIKPLLVKILFVKL